MKTLRTALLTGAILASTGSIFAGAIVSGFNSSNLPANDDGSTGVLNIGFTVNFFGTDYSQLWANNNGNLTFTGSMGTYTPFDLYTNHTPIIAPFFADVDTRGTGSDLLRYGTGTWGGRSAFGATWDGVGVGYYAYGTNLLNKFQTVLVNRSDVGTGDFDIYFNYDQIQWETGSASGGSGGLGGSSARAGYSNGDSAHSYELPGSAINGGLLDSNLSTGLIHGGNTGVAGRYVFQVRNGEIVIPPTPSTPDGASTLGLLSIVLLGFAAIRRRLT